MNNLPFVNINFRENYDILLTIPYTIADSNDILVMRIKNQSAKIPYTYKNYEYGNVKVMRYTR